ncbi:MAG: hypothetical protein H6719_30025 [Sandaracinaceae bacterium]|nr:hypothetical protein [Sandaracinaceae bacterium]
MIGGKDDDLVVGLCMHMELVPMPAPTPTPIPHPFLATIGDPSRKAAKAVGQPMKAAADAEDIDERPVTINGALCTNVGTITKNSSALPHMPLPPGTGWAPMPKPPKAMVGILATPPPPDLPVCPAGDALMDKGSGAVNFGDGEIVRLGDTCASCSEPARQVSTVIAIPLGPPVLVLG